MVSSVLAAAYGRLAIDETAADLPSPIALIDLPVLLGYAGLILKLAKAGAADRHAGRRLRVSLARRTGASDVDDAAVRAGQRVVRG